MLPQLPQQQDALHGGGEGVPQLKGHHTQAEQVHLGAIGGGWAGAGGRGMEMQGKDCESGERGGGWEGHRKSTGGRGDEEMLVT
jgi:hypothetical protein